MKELSLSNSEKKILIDDEDFELLSSYRWYLSKGTGDYSLIRSHQKTKNSSSVKKVLIHRIIMNPSTGESVDHINGDVFDNRRSNLRICNHSQNCKNRKKRKNSKNKYKGVYKRLRGSKVFYQAQVVSEGKLVYSGNFDSEDAAAIAYDLAAKSWHGEFASCNILSNGSI